MLFAQLVVKVIPLTASLLLVQLTDNNQAFQKAAKLPKLHHNISSWFRLWSQTVFMVLPLPRYPCLWCSKFVL